MFKPLFAAAAAAALAAGAAQAQDTIKIGEINSYKAQPAFLEPYKKGWELAVEEVNASGGVLGKKLQPGLKWSSGCCWPQWEQWRGPRPRGRLRRQRSHSERCYCKR